jgi:hypothetical protein
VLPERVAQEFSGARLASNESAGRAEDERSRELDLSRSLDPSRCLFDSPRSLDRRDWRR